MHQLTLARQAEFQRYTKKTRREQFLCEMEAAMPWAELRSLVEPHYSKGETGRKPVGLDIMLRVYFLQQWFALSDPGVEDALYESAVMRRFAGVDLGRAPAPDETTILNFRHLLEEHELCGQMLDAVSHYLASRGIRITTGTIVDATLIHAPSSTKNRKQSRDPEMHQAKKGKNWYFGMKAHVGVDSKTKIIHTAVATAANVADVAILPDLLHGDETRVWGDGAYQGQTEVIRECAPRARDFTQRRCRYKGQIVDEVAWAKNRTKSKVRARVEHVFQVLKLKFGFVKVRYRGLKKNAHRLFVTCALVNLFMSRRKLLAVA